MDILHLIDQLEALLNEGSHPPLVGKRVLLDEQRAWEIIDQMRVSIPEEVKKAKRINQERDRIIAQANEEGARIVELAQGRSAAVGLRNRNRQAGAKRAPHHRRTRAARSRRPEGRRRRLHHASPGQAGRRPGQSAEHRAQWPAETEYRKGLHRPIRPGNQRRLFLTDVLTCENQWKRFHRQNTSSNRRSLACEFYLHLKNLYPAPLLLECRII